MTQNVSLTEAKINLSREIFIHQCIEYLQQSDVMDHHTNTMGRLRLTNELRIIKNYIKGNSHDFEAAYHRLKNIAETMNIPIKEVP